MALVWNWYGAWGTLSLVVALALAFLILRQRPDRTQNRYLALALTMDGMSMGLGLGVLYFIDDYWLAYNVQVWEVVFLLGVPLAYLLFMSTLDVPLMRPLRSRVARGVLLVGVLALPLLVLGNPTWYVVDMQPSTYAPWDSVTGPGFSLGLALVAATAVVGLVVAAWYALRHRGTPHARAYLLAFGVRDAILAATILTEGLAESVRLPSGAPLTLLFAPLAILATTLLLAYGILKTQLFDIDLRLKWTLRRSTLVALFTAGFFVVSELIENVLPVEGMLPGLLAAGAVALGLQPLRRIADGLADRMMPHVRDTESYTLVRKREVYLAALDAARQDGEVTPREEAVLRRLAETLGLDEASLRQDPVEPAIS